MIGIMFAAALTATQVGTCKALEELAYMASLANQRGVPASKIIEIAGDDDIFQLFSNFRKDKKRIDLNINGNTSCKI